MHRHLNAKRIESYCRPLLATVTIFKKVKLPNLQSV